jgi:glycosyltransferase involved in cell wall biosynthesis
MVALKRHGLARKVERLALIYYDVECAEPGYFDSVGRALAHAAFLNEEAAHAAPALSAHGRAAALANRLLAARGFVMLPPAAVARHLNQARVGLCLSHDEAFMRAGVEYLLCGLPVVSTPTAGGRDFFFDAESALVAAPEPAAVRAAVAELIRRDLRPESIREGALGKIRQERRKFEDFVRAIYAAANQPPRFDHAWDRLFTESLFATTPLDRLLANEPAP